MPSNLKDYMQKQSRQSSMIHQQPPQQIGMRSVGKFTMSRNQCIDQLTNRLMELSRREEDLKMYPHNGTTEVLRKFQEDYSVLQKQIMRHVEQHLRDTKEKIIREIKDRRNVDMIDLKPIRKNVERLRHQLSSLREGLHRDNQYRQYISRVVRKDFESEIDLIRIEIKKLRFPNVHMSINEQHYSCFKNDLDRLIVTDDELMRGDFSARGIVGQSRPNDGTLSVNLHQNRDHIKRNDPDFYR